MVTITTDICIVGAGSAGLFAVLEAGINDFQCCVLDSGHIDKGDVKELALSEYLEAAIAVFNPVFVTEEFLKTLVKKRDGTFVVKATRGK